tara:strand:- start:353 stop:1291 length:939 start_codon:yes stop_codon:yes gene_type:complete
MAKLEQRKGLHGGFKPGSTGGPGTGKFINTVKRIASNVKRKAGDIASNIKNNKNEKAKEELAAEGSSKNPRFLQDVLNPVQNAAMTAGGSRPMTAMNNPQIDPITGMPIISGGQANMNPNFIGGMPNSNLPTTGMLAQEKKMKDYLLTGVTVDAEVNTKNPMNVIGPNKDLANFKPTTVKPDSQNPGIRGEQSPKSVVLNYNEVDDAKLDYRKRNSKVQHGAQANRDESFRKKLKKRSAALGVPDPVDSVLDFVSDSGPIFNQDKAIPKGTAGKGLRSLPISVRENMGYDPLSQERLTQSRRSTKCMRVKKR